MAGGSASRFGSEAAGLGALRAPRFFRPCWRPRSLIVPMFAAAPTVAQDALAGKRLYLDAARMRGTSVSCVDCHGGLPPGAFGIGRAANDPAAVGRAIETVPQMSVLRGRLQPADLADLAAFIGDPSVASPVVRVEVGQNSGEIAAAEKVEFGRTAAGSSVVAHARLANRGGLSMRLASAPRIVGPHAAEFSLTSACFDGQLLLPGAACSITLRFHPAARVQRIAHGGIADRPRLGRQSSGGCPSRGSDQQRGSRAGPGRRSNCCRICEPALRDACISRGV